MFHIYILLIRQQAESSCTTVDTKDAKRFFSAFTADTDDQI